MAYYCSNCKSTSNIGLMKSNGFLEVGLYFLYIIPGIIHSIWRRSGPRNVCPVCRQVGLITEEQAKQNGFLEKPSSLSNLKEAKGLLDDGAISQEEFDLIKKRTLS